MMSFLILATAFWLYCAAFFCVIQKPLFGLYNHKSMAPGDNSLRNISRIYTHGFVSDAIVASYLTAVPLLLGALHTLLPYFNLLTLLIIYCAIAALAVGALVAADTALYRFWQFKLDASVFTYLRSLKGATASVSTSYIILATLVWLAISAIFFIGCLWICDIYCRHTPAISMPWWGYIATLTALAAAIGILFLIIRGLKIRPNNPSVVYFSKSPFLNHWALNPGYNLIYSLTTKDEFRKQFRHFSDEECQRITAPLFPTTGTPLKKLLNTDRPNILLVVWESLGAGFMESLGGKKGVAENRDRLASEGVLFTRCTAGSFRTDRGLVCILSGYLGQPTTSIIRYTRKLPHLPALPRTLRDHGYETTAVHGGDLTIMHKSDYYLASGHDRLVSQKDMPKSAPAGKWGIDDGYMFQWLYDDIMEKTDRGARWFTTLQTLSSHEPFTVPYHRLDNKVDNSFAYTDHCFGELVEKLKHTPAWDNLLIICVADHGLGGGNSSQPRNEYAHIPVLLTGGAVKAPARIDTIMSQTDIAATILGQMGLPHDDFTFSRDILADTYTRPFSFHTYNNGFMFTDANGHHTVYDNVAEQAIVNPDAEREKTGKAILQKLYDDLADK